MNKVLLNYEAVVKAKGKSLTKIICWSGRTSGIVLFYAKVFIVLIACMLFFFAPFARKFIILNYNTNKILYLSNVNSGDRFNIAYTHSVNKSPVEDQFIIDNEYNIVLSKSIFKSFGAGILSTFNGSERFEFFEDRIEVSYNNRKIDKLILSVGTIAGHRFMMNGKSIRLNELADPHTSVYFLADRVTLFQLLTYSLCN